MCTLLEDCGQYFTRGVARRKLDSFLPYLQRYLLAKPPLPLDVEFDVQVRGERGGEREGERAAAEAELHARWPVHC